MTRPASSHFRKGLILRTMGPQVLDDLSSEHRDLLETASAIHESDGSLAIQHIESGWCRLLHAASPSARGAAGHGDAAGVGQWGSQGCCCAECSHKAVHTGQSVDMACPGGIQIHAEPIRAGGRVIGSIQFAYGDPPTDAGTLGEIATRYGVDIARLRDAASSYRSRPEYLIALAMKRARSAARLIGAMVESRRAEAALRDRLKELRCLHGISHILSQEDLPLRTVLERCVRQIPGALRWPTSAIARIRVMDQSHATGDFCRARDILSQQVIVGGQAVGSVDIAYVDYRHYSGEEPFLQEERDMLADIAQQLGQAMDRIETKVALDAILANSPVAIFAIDMDGRVTFWNDAAQRIFGWTADQAIGQIAPWVPVDMQQDYRSKRTQALAEGLLLNQELIRQRKDGTRVWCKMSASVLSDASGDPKGLVIVAEDLTQQHKAQDHIQRLERASQSSQRLESIGHMAGGIAHDFNNLLTVINSYARMSIEGLHQEDPLREDLCAILDAGEQAAGLTRQLLAFSSRQTLAPAVLDLNAIIQRLDRMLRRIIREDITLCINLASELGRVRADPAQIEQMLMNLVINARDALPGCGTLTITTANVELSGEVVAMNPGARCGPAVMLSISDDGIGMSEEVRQRIFEPFFTTKARGRGTGLGLATVYGLVKQSGGHIVVTSEEGGGTTFEIYLPRVSAETSRPVEALAPLRTVRGTERVLLVEDELAVRNLTRRVLLSAGYRVLTAANGGEALLVCERTAGPIHLLLTDVVMPHMSGQRLAERLLADRPELRVLFMSGYTDNVLQNSTSFDLSRQLISKPFKPHDLLERVRRALDAERVANGLEAGKG